MFDRPRLERMQREGLLQRIMPSMFQRRLRLLALMVLAVCAALLVQMTRLTVSKHEALRAKAEAVLTRSTYIPTSRGRILDRHERTLAYDRPAYDIAVDYRVITGEWAYDRAASAARAANAERWPQLHLSARMELTRQHLPQAQELTERFWEDLCGLEGIDRAELERRKAAVVERVHQMASHLRVVWARERAAELDEPVELVGTPIREERQRHPLLMGVDSRVVAEVKRLIDMSRTEKDMEVWSQVEVVPSRQREYPLTTLAVVLDRSTLPGPLKSDQPLEVTVRGVATHLLGGMRDVWREDVEGVYDAKGNLVQPGRPFKVGDRIDLGGYLPGDRTGSTGVEAAQERVLRGMRGREVEDLQTLTRTRVEPVAGKDVVLTIDAHLQARIQAIMDPTDAGPGLMRVQPWHYRDVPPERIGLPLNGAAVVLDVDTGHILAAVSIPTWGPEQIAADPEAYFGDKVNQPYLNRPIGVPYQPGSTVKPLVLCAAVTEREFSLGNTITCHGYLGYPDASTSHQRRCWIYKSYNATHGPLGGAEAIARSCNIFFFTLGQHMGLAKLTAWYERFGLGSRLGCGLDPREESPGSLPDKAMFDRPEALPNAIMMGIGQGPVNWTVLQAANAYATIARGGYMLTPTLVSSGQQRGVDLHINPRAIDTALKGMYQSLNEPYGSGHHVTYPTGRENTFDIEGVRLMGKTGTADTGTTWIDENGNGQRDPEEVRERGDHAWTIVLVQREGRPHADFVVAVCVEFAGSGGNTSGPIVNQIIHALRAEGYL